MSSAALILGIGAAAAHRSWQQGRVARHPTESNAAPVGPIRQIADRLYLVPDGCGVTTVFVTSGGTVLVDPPPSSGAALLRQVRLVTDTPVTHVIATHSHHKDLGGAPVLAPGGRFVVHERAAASVATLRGAGDFRLYAGKPVLTVSDYLRLFDGRDAVDLYHFGRGHTDGDLVVVFPDAGVMYAGQLFPGKLSPTIDLTSGGDPHEFPRTLRRASVGLIGSRRVITPNSGVLSWQDFINYADFVNLLVTQAEGDILAGRTWEGAMKSLALDDRFSDYDLRTLPNTMQDIYKGETPWWKVWVR